MKGLPGHLRTAALQLAVCIWCVQPMGTLRRSNLSTESGVSRPAGAAPLLEHLLEGQEGQEPVLDVGGPEVQEGGPGSRVPGERRNPVGPGSNSGPHHAGCEPIAETPSGCSKPQANRMMSMDPVQNDLRLLGVVPETGDLYNIHTPPLPHQGGPLLVSISISLRNILEIDELRQLITLETTIRLYWQDYRLNVTHLLPENHHPNATDDYILLNPGAAQYIWFPDVYIDFAKALRIPKFMVAPASLRIYRNSTARYATQNNYDVACPMNFRNYPYDTQICKVKYESYGYTTHKMLLKWKKGFDHSKVTANNSISLAQFEYAVKFEEEYREAIASGEYPGVIMTIVLRRKINYHLLQTYLPSGLFVIVAWLSLFLPPESIPGRVAMAMTTLLTLAAMFGAVRQNTPRVSYVSALDIWMCTCVIFVFFTLLEYVIVLCLIYRKTDGDEEEETAVLNHVSISTVEGQAASKDQILDLEPEEPTTKRRARFCPAWRRRQCRPQELKHSNCHHKSLPRKKRAVKANNFHLKVERVCRITIAIMFIVFNAIYWPTLMADDGLDQIYRMLNAE